MRAGRAVARRGMTMIVTFTSGVVHDFDGPVWLLVKPTVSTVIV
jgi:hypothetical protein